MVRLQGGDPGIVDNSLLLPQARSTNVIEAARDGYVVAIDCEQMGTACVALGGGRERAEDSVDHAVGLVLHKKVGDAVAKSEVLCTIHHSTDENLLRARMLIEESYDIGSAPPAKLKPLVHKIITDV